MAHFGVTFCSQKARPESKSCPRSRQFCPAALSTQCTSSSFRLAKIVWDIRLLRRSLAAGSGGRPIWGFRGQLSNCCCHYVRQLGYSIGATWTTIDDDPTTIATTLLLPPLHCHCHYIMAIHCHKKINLSPSCFSYGARAQPIMIPPACLPCALSQVRSSAAVGGVVIVVDRWMLPRCSAKCGLYLE